MESRQDAWKRISDLVLGDVLVSRKEYFLFRQHRILYHDAEAIARGVSKQFTGNREELFRQTYLAILGIPTAKEYQMYVQMFGHPLTLTQQHQLQQVLFGKARSEKEDAERDKSFKYTYLKSHGRPWTKEDGPLYESISLRDQTAASENEMLMRAILTLEYDTQGLVYRSSFVVHPDHPFLSCVCRGFLMLKDTRSGHKSRHERSSELDDETDPIPEHFRVTDYDEAFYPLYFIFDHDTDAPLSLSDMQKFRDSTQHRPAMQYLMMITQRQHCCLIVCRKRHIKYILVEIDTVYAQNMKKFIIQWTAQHLSWRWFPEILPDRKESFSKTLALAQSFFHPDAGIKQATELNVQHWLEGKEWKEPYSFFTGQDVACLEEQSKTAKAFGFPPEKTIENERITAMCLKNLDR